MRILVVDDEEKTAAFLLQGLQEGLKGAFHAVVVDVVHDGLQAVEKVMQSTRTPQHLYSLVVLDVMLPSIDGWEVLTQLKAKIPALPILILTARDSVDDRVKGLRLGADDYLVKPFAFSELLARVEGLLRRFLQPTGATSLVFGDLCLNLLTQKLERAGKPIPLTQKEYQILSLLIQRPNVGVSREVIAKHVWGVTQASETNVVDVHIRRLRAKMDDAYDIKHIKTMRGIGYFFDANSEKINNDESCD